MFIRETVDNQDHPLMLPQLIIDYVKPGSHPCQRPSCISDLTAHLKQQLFKEVQNKVRESLREEVIREERNKKK